MRNLELFCLQFVEDRLYSVFPYFRSVFSYVESVFDKNLTWNKNLFSRFIDWYEPPKATPIVSIEVFYQAMIVILTDLLFNSAKDFH